jgi:hypothetical protein
MPISKETENSYGLTNKKHYQSIANSLRSLYRSDETYFPEDMAACLESESSNPEFNSKNIKKGVTFFGVTGECVPGEEIDGIEWPEDNHTHLWLELESHRCNPTLHFIVTGTVAIDWGDGTNTKVTAGGERVS